ncbi:MAG: hypothetical protein J0H73_03465, partial [Salana multivorans]|nr:hypothetical protein [Salana multivorans]
DLDRFRLVIDVIDRVPGLAARYAGLRQRMADKRIEARAYTRAHGEDLPEIAEWVWPDATAPAATGDDGSTGINATLSTGGDNE